MRQRRHRRRSRRAVLRPHHLRVPAIRQHIRFILPVPRIHQKIKPPVRILHLCQKIRLPFRLLQQIALPIPAFRNAQIVQCSHSAEGVRRKHQIMYQRRAVDRVLAVISGVVMTSGYIHLSLVHKRIELRRLVGEPRSALPRIVRIDLHRVVRNRVPRERKRGLRRRNCRPRRVTGVVHKARVRQRIVRPASLVIQSQGVGPREPHRDALIDQKRQRRAQSGHHQFVLPGVGKPAEIGLENILVRQGRIIIPEVQPRGQLAPHRSPIVPALEIKPAATTLSNAQMVDVWTVLSAIGAYQLYLQFCTPRGKPFPAGSAPPRPSSSTSTSSESPRRAMRT